MKKIVVKAIVIVLMIAIAKFGIQKTLESQDQKYASNYFSSMPFETVLESRRWNQEALGCTYAVVSLEDAVPFEPPNQWLNGITWNKTPLRFKEESRGQCRNLICQCEADWNPPHYQRLDRALSHPGSFYYLLGLEPPHDTIHQAVIFIYSQAEGVAAQVRFGD